MKRAAIYARFSSDLQRDKSIEDQVAVCRTYAERNGYVVVQVYDDRAMSGASLHGRTGMLRLLGEARTDRFDFIIAESLSRIARNQADSHTIRDRLTFVGVGIVTTTDGEVTNLTHGLRSIIDSQQLDDLKVQVRRGMSGVIRDGRHAGGRAYGYRPVKGEPGVLVIVEEEAEVVRRIFTEYVDGAVPRDIAAGLNRDGITPPRGRRWNASALNGSHARGYGILSNAIYDGRLVWNRIRMVKDPETGKRVSRINDQENWQTVKVPALRIVDEKLFAAAQVRRGARSVLKPAHCRKPRHAFSGLLKCGTCGGGMSVKDRDHGRVRIQCTTRRESGSCSNGRNYYLDELTSTVVTGLRQHLLDPRAVSRFLKTYHEERKRLAAGADAARAKLERRLGETSREIERAITVMLKATDAAELFTPRIEELNREKRAIEAELAQVGEPVNVVALHPRAVELYLAKVEELEKALAGGEGEQDPDLLQAVRDLVESITVQPQRTGEKLTLDVKGKIERLIGAEPMFGVSGGKMVAEEGLEPPTRGL